MLNVFFYDGDWGCPNRAIHPHRAKSLLVGQFTHVIGQIEGINETNSNLQVDTMVS